MRALPRSLLLASLALALWLVYTELGPREDLLGYRAFALNLADYTLSRGMNSPPRRGLPFSWRPWLCSPGAGATCCCSA